MVAIKGPAAKKSGKAFLKKSGGTRGDLMEWRDLSQDKRKALKTKYKGDVGAAVKSVVGKPGGESKYSAKEQARTKDSKKAETPRSQSGGGSATGSTSTPTSGTAHVSKQQTQGGGHPPSGKAKDGKGGASTAASKYGASRGNSKDRRQATLVTGAGGGQAFSSGGSSSGGSSGGGSSGSSVRMRAGVRPGSNPRVRSETATYLSGPKFQREDPMKASVVTGAGRSTSTKRRK